MGALHVLDPVALADCRAKVPQTLGDGGRFQIRTRHRVAARQQNLGDAVHAAAAYPDQMNPLKVAQRDTHRRTTPSITSTMASTACGRPSERARASISSILRGWSRREKISVVNRSGVSSSWGSSRAAPALCITCALRA